MHLEKTRTQFHCSHMWKEKTECNCLLPHEPYKRKHLHLLRTVLAQLCLVYEIWESTAGVNCIPFWDAYFALVDGVNGRNNHAGNFQSSKPEFQIIYLKFCGFTAYCKSSQTKFTCEILIFYKPSHLM